MKKLLLLAFNVGILTLTSLAQDTPASDAPRKYKRPDIPGTFVVEYGLNIPSHRPDKFQLNVWGSRTINVYYQYDMRILKAKVSFHPGIGLSLERYKFKNNYTVDYDNNGTLVMLSPTDYGHSIRKSQLITNYLEVPLELRYSTNPEDPTRSFKISIGARGGVLVNSFTKVKYVEDGEKHKIKNKQPYNLNQFRYGLYAKIGAGNFAIFGYYNLTTVFKTGRAPVFNTTDTPAEMQNLTIGISLSSF